MINMSQSARDALNERLNYWVNLRIKSTDFGLPQNKQRIFIVGFNKDYYGDIDFETNSHDIAQRYPNKCETDLQSDNEVDPKYTISQKLLEVMNGEEKNIKKGNGFGSHCLT